MISKHWTIACLFSWALLCATPLRVEAAPTAANSAAPATEVSAHYVGSRACEACHPKIFERWKKTPMANVVRDPREYPDAIVAHFSQPNPLVKFTKNDVAFAYGSVWKQRYFTKIGDDYFPEPAQWDIQRGKWLPYFVKAGED